MENSIKNDLKDNTTYFAKIIIIIKEKKISINFLGKTGTD